MQPHDPIHLRRVPSVSFVPDPLTQGSQLNLDRLPHPSNNHMQIRATAVVEHMLNRRHEALPPEPRLQRALVVQVVVRPRRTRPGTEAAPRPGSMPEMGHTNRAHHCRDRLAAPTRLSTTEEWRGLRSHPAGAEPISRQTHNSRPVRAVGDRVNLMIEGHRTGVPPATDAKAASVGKTAF